MPTTWEGVAQTIVTVWALALIFPTLVYLIPRAMSRAEQASDRDKGIIHGSTNRTGLPALRDEGE